MEAPGLRQDVKGIVKLDIPEPDIRKDTDVLVTIVRAGICGTDRAMIASGIIYAPPGEDFLVLGHEAIGRVEDIGKGAEHLRPGNLVALTVRRGCDECPSCWNNASDMCFTGRYRERGIHKLHGFFTRHIVDEEQYFVRLHEELEPIAVLAEPLSIGEKAREQMHTIQQRVLWQCPHPQHRYATTDWGRCKTALVIGAGPIGLLGTCLLRLANVKTHVLEIVGPEHTKVKLIRELGALYIDGRALPPEQVPSVTGELDIIFEASGVSQLALDLTGALGRNGIYIFCGVPSGTGQVKLDGNMLLRQSVRYNQVFVGSVNSNRRHFEAAANDLFKIEDRWGDVLRRAITHRIPFSEYRSAFELSTHDQLKVTLEMD